MDTEELSTTTLEAALNQLMDTVVCGTGVVKWSVLNDPTTWTVHPECIHIHPSLYRVALKVLRGPGWHYKNTARWRYLVKRGARK
jgi:hypothetical protein